MEGGGTGRDCKTILVESGLTEVVEESETERCDRLRKREGI